MNRNYVKGVKFEREVMSILSDQGYFCLRSAGSHSWCDVVAVNLNEVKFIQCKTTKDKNVEGIVKKVLFELLDNKVYEFLPECVVVEVWVKGPGRVVKRVVGRSVVDEV